MHPLMFDLTIVGAGLVGASLVAGLARSGLKLALVEPERAPESLRGDWDSRIYAISPGSHAFLAACGAWSRIDADRLQPVQAMRVRGDDNAAELMFSAYEAGLPELCHIVESRAIEQALEQVLADCDEITVFRPSQPESLDFGPDSARLTLADGRGIESRLIVGADGAHSWIRQATGIASDERDYGQLGVVANFDVQSAHSAIAFQWFRRDGVFALLPMPGNRVSMVWSTWDEAARRLAALSVEDLQTEVEAAADHLLGTMRLTNAPQAFALRLIRVAELVRPRVALIGDAAHTVHPLAGQGVNLGFQDARTLADVLRGRNAQDDCGDWRLLRRYARARKEAIASMQLVTDGLQRLFNNQGPGLRWLRNTGLSLTDRVTPLKKMLIERALG